MDQSGQDYSMQLYRKSGRSCRPLNGLERQNSHDGKTVDIVVESDASTHGWGATCDGVGTGGPWSPEESQWHINCLEAPGGLSNPPHSEGGPDHPDTPRECPGDDAPTSRMAYLR
jgi:hypothetical protein